MPQTTEIKPKVCKITVYPVKSLDGISLQKAQVGRGGCLLHDREYAIVDNNGGFVNGKSNADVHLLRSELDVEKNTISLKHEYERNWNSFHLQNEIAGINNYLSDFFKMPVSLLKNSEGRFMDIPDVAGITILSSASLEAVSGWFNAMDMEETRKRFRATIEMSGVPAFWEDRLFLEEETVVEFKIGDLVLHGISPRARCVVPSRHPETAHVTHGFPRSFAKARVASLPAWSTLNEYGHFYYLTVNCFIPPTETGKWISIGDEIKVTGKKHANPFRNIH